MARKPFASTVAENVLEHGTGALHIDACRIDAHDGVPQFFPGEGRGANATGYDMGASNRTGEYSYAGRWPANLIHDGSEDVIALFHAQSGALPADSGSAARFFYCAKASKDDRDEGLRGFEAKNNMRVNGPRENEEAKRQTLRANHHPTVKPVDLMAYLCRLVTPKGGIVLDPFMGSGSTGKAAVRENFRFIGIEREADYIAIAHARIAFELRKGFQHSLLEGAP